MKPCRPAALLWLHTPWPRLSTRWPRLDTRRPRLNTPWPGLNARWPNKSAFGGFLLISWGVLAGLTGCASDEAEVRGSLNRVVGETVTLELVQGETTFQGDLTLDAAEGATYSATDLQTTLVDDHTLSLVIPTGIPQGKAVIHAEHSGDGAPYAVPLHVDRLAFTLTQEGLLEIFPLPSGKLERKSFELGSLPAAMALVPSAGELVLMNQQEVRLLGLGETIEDVSPGIVESGGMALAAIPHGTLMATDQAVLLLPLAEGSVITQQAIAFSGARAVAAASDGSSGAVLGPCPSEPSGSDAICVTELILDQGITLGQEVQLPNAVDPKVMAMSGDGSGTVVGDTQNIFGVYWANPAVQSQLAWGFDAQPVDIDRTVAQVQTQNIDLFAVADAAEKKIFFVGFNSAQNFELQRAAEANLPEAPSAISYGRRTSLYIASGTGLYTVDVGQKDAEPTLLDVSASGPIISLDVQR